MVAYEVSLPSREDARTTHTAKHTNIASLTLVHATKHRVPNPALMEENAVHAAKQQNRCSLPTTL
jgi:hypothetical protein